MNGSFVVIASKESGWGLTLEKGLYLLGSAIAGWTLVTLLATLLPHWFKRGYAAVLLGVVGLACLAASTDLIWGYFEESPANWNMLVQRVVVCGLVAVVAGLLAIEFGRPLVRGIVRVVIPPRMRPPFAYLWQVDGKVLPWASGNATSRGASYGDVEK